MKTRQIFKRFKLSEPTTHETLRVKINNEIPPSHKDFQSNETDSSNK